MSDEMGVLIRTAVELTVNSCYLADASDEEVNRYFHFDVISAMNAINDFGRSVKGNEVLPAAMVRGIAQKYEKATLETDLRVGNRLWSRETKNLAERAAKIDERWNCESSGLVAAYYAMGSTYTHGSNRVLVKHAKYLMNGERQHPLVAIYSVNADIQGIMGVILLLCRFLAKRCDRDDAPSYEMGVEAARLLDVATADLRLHRKQTGSPELP